VGALPYTTSTLGSVIEQDFVEHRTLDLVSGGVLAAKDVLKEKAIAPSATGGNDLAAIFHNEIGLIDFLSHAHPFEDAKTAGQERFSDFETGELFLFKDRNLPAVFCQQSSSRAASWSTTDDGNVEKLSHNA
jgi:hypothetical protein